MAATVVSAVLKDIFQVEGKLFPVKGLQYNKNGEQNKWYMCG